MVLKRIFRRRPAAPAVSRFGEVPAVAAELEAWVRSSRRLSPARLLIEAQPFLIDAEHADAAAHSALEQRLALAFDRAAHDELLPVPVEARVAAWLAAQGRREELATFTVERTHTAGQFPTRLVGAQVLADFGELRPRGIPEAMLEVERPLTELEVRIRRCGITAEGVRLELFAVVRALDYSRHRPVITVIRAGAEVPLMQVEDPAASRFSARRHQNHDVGTAHLVLPDAARDLRVSVTVGEFRRTAMLPASRISARLPGPAQPRQISSVAVVDDVIRFAGSEVEVPLETERRFRPRGPRPSGEVTLPDLQPDPALAGALPVELFTDRHRVEISTVDGRLRMHVAAPLTDDERGPWCQTRLQEQHGMAPIDDRLALFSAFAGTGVTDSPLAIQQELHRRDPGMRILWAVADHSVDVPEGAEPVLVRSRAWYDAWSRARLVVTNVEPDRWYKPRAGQLLVQTFHGYPSKTMGKVLWESKNFSPRRIRYQLEHTSGTWGLLVTPDEAMDRHYREQYEWDGPIVHLGYPRNDDLVGPAARERRERVRADLGIGDRVAVLHAPTWRDDKASNFRKAEAVELLDVDAFHRALPDHVVLMRGHRFHAAGEDRPGVIDVTAHPQINDLILAADVAVLDYSSLRFDFALTGRPIVFLVPDLTDYTLDARGFLYPFEESAPGPMVADTAAVVEHVRDVHALQQQTAEQMSDFNQRFNRHHDGRAAERVVEAIEQLLSGGGPGASGAADRMR